MNGGFEVKRRKLARVLCVIGLLAGCLAGGAPRVDAAQQTITFRDGWNLVALDVGPTDPSPAAVFGPLGPAFKSAWTHCRPNNSRVFSML